VNAYIFFFISNVNIDELEDQTFILSIEREYFLPHVLYCPHQNEKVKFQYKLLLTM